MNVLIACEFSGIVRDAFLALGHHAISADLIPSERPGPHRVGDVRLVLDQPWDLMVAHPPCTYLANSGVRWLYGDDSRWQKMVDAARFFRELLDAPIPHIAVENPIIHGHAREIIGRRQDQVIQPWMFGHGEVKATCLWLKNLPPLTPTNIVPEREARVHRMAPSPDRWKERSRTLPGIAQAMAEQWSAAIASLEEVAS